MADEPETSPDETESSIELSTMSDHPRFRSDEMVVCSTCSRTNPPNRAACLYCGHDLEIDGLLPDAVRLTFQRPEAWEDGFTIAYLGQKAEGHDVTAEAAAILHLDADVLSALTQSNAVAPVAYLRSLSEAQIVASRLDAIGVACAIAGDDLLLPRTPPSRLRGIAFGGSGAVFSDFNTQSRYEFAATDRMLLVIGVICKTRSETTAKRTKRSMKVTDAAESLNDELAMDVYPPSDVFGFRVRPTGFDFSCLGAEMRKTGAENLRILVGRLRECFPTSKLIDTYSPLRFAIDNIWPVGEGDRSSSVSRASFGGVRVHRVAVVDNTEQFNRFSRLQRHLL